MEIRDPIHGFVCMEPELEPFLDLQALQRLRRIKQTAMTCLVYPGATNTRFEHSLGCMHLAGRLANSLKEKGLELSEERIKEIKIAALLHDIGHGPFSHVSELVFPRPQVDSGEAIHERVTRTIIDGDEQLSTLLGSRKDSVRGLLSKPEAGLRSVDRDIINGPFDADKLDYLLRDSHYAGVKYGIFDLERIVNTVTPIKGQTESYMGIKEDGFYAVEQLVLAKHHMNLQVYRHRVRRITDAMLVRAIKFAMNEKVPNIEQLYTFPETKEAVAEYVKWDDDSLLRAILQGPGKLSKEYAERLLERRLLKEVYYKNIREEFKDALVRDRISRLANSKLRTAEQRIADVIRERAEIKNLEAEFVIVDIQSSDNPTYRPPGPEIRPGDIIVVNDKGERVNASEFPTSILGEGNEPREEFVSVYAAVDTIEKAKIESSISEIFIEI